MKTAIARIVVNRDDGTERIGTGFLVARQYLLTAFHVVGDRAKTDDITPNIFTHISVYFDHIGFKTTATVVPGAFDVLSDWALVQIDQAPQDVLPIPLGAIQDEDKIEFKTWGYPVVARLSQSSLALDGYIQDLNSQYQGAPALQLYCKGAAAGLADPLNGLSGAPCIVENCAVGIIRSNLVTVSASNAAPHIVGGVLYACPIDIPTIRDRCAKLISPIDPIRGLPGIPPSPLPKEPFRYLHWYGPAEAEVFFGRNSLIRQIFSALIDENSPHLTLVYGASGVGKSSLIRAAIASRLHGTHIVVHAQCNANTEAFATLTNALGTSHDVDLLKRLVILDQLDEALIGSPQSSDNILSNLALELAKIIETQSKTRVIILFRSEWLAQIRSRFDEYALARHEFHIERPGREDIRSIVRGIASTPRLRSFYRAEVDEQLGDSIADDLLSDPNSPITPLLSIVMTKLWANSQLEDGSRRLSNEKYAQQMRERISLRGFIDEQLLSLSLLRSKDIENGLVTSVLFELTTPEGTARSVSLADLRKKFQLLDAGEESKSYIDGVLLDISKFSLCHLESRQDGKDVMYRLAHDTLAPIVREDFFRSSLPGQRAERILRTRARDHDQEVFTPLDDADLILVEKGLGGMRALSTMETTILAKSRVESHKRAMHRRAFKISAALASVMIVTLGLISVVLWQIAGNIYTASIKQRAHGLADLSRLKMATDTGASLQLALAAASLDSFLDPAKLLKQVLNTPPEWARVGDSSIDSGCKAVDLMGSSEKIPYNMDRFVAISSDFTSQIEVNNGFIVQRSIPDGKLLNKKLLGSNEFIWNKPSKSDLLITTSKNSNFERDGTQKLFEYSIYPLSKISSITPVATGKAKIINTTSGGWPVVAINENDYIQIQKEDGSFNILDIKIHDPTQLFVAPGGSAAVVFEQDLLHWIALDGSGKYEKISWPKLDLTREDYNARSFFAWGPDDRRFFIANADRSNRWINGTLKISAVNIRNMKSELLKDVPYTMTGLNRPVFAAASTGARIMWSTDADVPQGHNIEIADIVWPEDSSPVQLKLIPIETNESKTPRKFPFAAMFSTSGNRLILAEDVNVAGAYAVGKLSIMQATFDREKNLDGCPLI